MPACLVPPANPNGPSPTGLRAIWIGDYYTAFRKTPPSSQPDIAASFVGFAPTPALSEIWKQGSSLKKSGRISKANHFELQPLVSGNVEITLEGKDPNGTAIEWFAGDKKQSRVIQKGSFSIHERVAIPPNIPLVITTSSENIFWTKIRIVPVAGEIDTSLIGIQSP
jgi:hypothetical protein